MKPQARSLLTNIAALVLIAGAFFFLLQRQNTSAPTISGIQPASTTVSTSSQTASVSTAIQPPPPIASSTKPAKTAAVAKATPAKNAATASTPNDQVERIENPYPTPPESSDQVNAAARAALVNIMCMPRGGGALSPISGSGTIIDPRGVILTNAHVAQYVLLSQSQQIDLSCTIRTGSPATAHYSAEVLYIPTVWVQAHASEITEQHPTGTGEHDYALLLITGSVDNSPLPTQFPYLQPDTREGIAFQGDQVLVASYPAEFLGGIAAEYGLYPVSSVTTIGQLMTFAVNSIDLLSLGGIIEAQGGSSGGAVVNGWGRLVGLIATTSGGDTTAVRDLRAITLSYIDRDLVAQTQIDLTAILGGDVAAEAANFDSNAAPALTSLYISQLQGH